MLAEIITIGDEILIGQTIDTNSAFIAQELNQNGIRVAQITSISDNKNHILEAIKSASCRAKIIIITGGLGPTKDDITKSTLCELFNSKLIRNPQVYEMVSDFFTKRGKPFTELNQNQALVPEACRVILNPNGTAPGMWFQKDNIDLISLPGVPYEMKWMLKEKVIPELIKNFHLPEISHFTIFTQGIGESFLAQKIESWEEKVKKSGFALAYLPSPGNVKLRLSAYSLEKNFAKISFDKFYKELEEQIGDHIFGVLENNLAELSLQKVVADLLNEKNFTIATAESCTGGFLSHLLTSIPGSSQFFRGSVIAYHNQHKTELLDVKPEIFEKFGAVSEECVCKMAESVRIKFDCDYAIATSGIAGPSGGTNEKPVGTVWIAISNKNKSEARKFQFGNDRLRNISMASQAALAFLREVILKKN